MLRNKAYILLCSELGCLPHLLAMLSGGLPACRDEGRAACGVVLHLSCGRHGALTMVSIGPDLGFMGP